MIKTGYTVRAGFPKHVMNNEKTVFQIGIKDKAQEGKWFNVSFMCDYIELDAREEVQITEIVGFNVSEYNGKQQFTVFGSIEKVLQYEDGMVGELEHLEANFEKPDNKIVIDDDTLPF